MTVPHAARDRSAVPGWTQGCTDKARSTSRQRYYHSCLCRVLQVSMFSLKPQYRRWVVYTRTASLLICFKCAASPRGYSRGCAEKLENTNWECSQGWKDRREEWKKMLFQISQYLRWFTYQEYILNIMMSVQGKAQMEYFCIKHSQETTSSFPVSGHIIIKKIMAQNKEGPFLFQVWSTVRYSSLQLCSLSVRCMLPMNFWSKGFSITMNTVHKNIITTSRSWNPHCRKGHQPLQHHKVSHKTSLTSVRTLCESRSSFLRWGDAPRGKFTLQTLKVHQYCEEPLQLTPLKPKCGVESYPC